jgi:hypothetical protein
MLHARTANTMDLAAHVPLATERQDMRYQWISRFLQNDLIEIAEIMDPIAKSLFNKLTRCATLFEILNKKD